MSNESVPTTRAILCALAVVLYGCSSGGSSPAPVEPAPLDPFTAVDQAARAAFVAEGVSGMGLAIYDRKGVKIFERMYGDFAPDRRVAIASASKLVSGVVLFRLIDRGYLSLDSTTGAVLGWTGDRSAITLRHLLSFTSGLDPSHACILQATITLAECVDRIAMTDLIAAPGTRFDYGSTHLHVAARMAEVVVGESWNEIFAAELRRPLGLPPDLAYYTHPQQANGVTNPLIAGGLRTSMNDYARLLQFVFDKGRWQETALLAPEVFDEQAVELYPDAVVGNSPAQNSGFDFRYGLTAWLECDAPATGCATVSSPGGFGFTPWIDRGAGYFAILGMEYTENSAGVVAFAVELEQQLKPLIIQATPSADLPTSGGSWPLSHPTPWDGRTRSYQLHLPTGFMPGDGAVRPLVVALHGGGGNGPQFESASGYSLKADAENFIVVYPSGIGALGTWNASTHCCGPANVQNVDDVRFLKDLAARLSAQYAIDSRKVFATGHSNGGVMSWRLGCDAPEVFSAIGPNAADSTTLHSDGAPCDLGSRRVRVVNLHGDADDRMPYRGGAGSGAEPYVRQPVEDPDSTLHGGQTDIGLWTALNGCDFTPLDTVTTSGYVKKTFCGASAVQVVNYKVLGGGHEWYDTSNSTLSSTDTTWSFFASGAPIAMQ
ncbi:MAG: serine hydrolase [Steroidobacter sp.]